MECIFQSHITHNMHNTLNEQMFLSHRIEFEAKLKDYVASCSGMLSTMALVYWPFGPM